MTKEGLRKLEAEADVRIVPIKMIISGPLSNPSIKITVMGQTTANYKPPCAEMSYDLCVVSTGRRL